MAKAEYRSAIRSKNLIKKAVAKLIHEKDISKINFRNMFSHISNLWVNLLRNFTK